MSGEQPDGTPKLEKVEVKRHLSISQLNLLSTCGEAYRRRYILKQRTAPGISMLVGSAVDKAVTQNLFTKIEKGNLLTLEEIRSLTVAEYNQRITECDGDIEFKQTEIAEGKEESIAAGRQKALRLSELHAQIVAPILSPMFVQRPLSFDHPDYPFSIGGIIDIQEPDAVRDTKAKAKTPAKDTADRDDQLTMYALLVLFNDGAIPAKLVLDCLIDTKIPKYVPLETMRTEEDFNPLLQRIHAAHIALERGVFIPAKETDWCCSPDYCSFFKSCKYVKHSRRPAA
jgi:hypothetical protein